MDEISVCANHRAYDEIFLRYRVLADVGQLDLGRACGKGVPEQSPGTKEYVRL